MEHRNIWNDGRGIWRPDWIVCTAVGLLAGLLLDPTPWPEPPPPNIVSDCNAAAGH